MAFDVPPPFRFGPGIDWSPLASAITDYQQMDVAKNRLAMDQKRLGFEEKRLGWEGELQPYRVENLKLGNTRDQQSIDREKATLPLDLTAKKQGIASGSLDLQAKRDAAEKELYGRAAAIAQMIEGEPDQARQREMLNKFYSADPRIKGAIGEKLPKELLDDPIAVARYMRAVHAGYQAPQTVKVGKDEALVSTSRDPNNPAAPPKTGVIFKNDGNDQFKDEHQLRQEISNNPTIKNFHELKSGYGRIIEGRKLGSGVGDISIVFGYMKMLDPTSVVREGEYATAANAAGVPEKVKNAWNAVMNGEKLPDTLRLEFEKGAEALYGRALSDVNKVGEHYKGLATSYRLDPKRVVPDFGIANPPPSRLPPPAPPFNPPRGMQDVVNGRGVQKPAQDRLPQSTPPRVTNEQEYNALPPGTQYMAPDGSMRTKR